MAQPSFDMWGYFEENLTNAFPGATCAKVTVDFISVDNELVSIGMTRDGFVKRLEEFEDDDQD